MEVKDVFANILPVLGKVAPILCASIKSPIGQIACAILAAALETPVNPHAVVKKLEEDESSYDKLQLLESTHGEWLEYLRDKHEKSNKKNHL